MKKRYSGIIKLMLILACNQGISQLENATDKWVDTSINGYRISYHVEDNNEEIYFNLMEWAALNQDAILLNDRGKLISRGNLNFKVDYLLYEFLKGEYNKEVEITIRYTLIITIQDRKYTIELVLPDKTKVTQVYGPYIYTDIKENDLLANYNNAIIEEDFLKKIKGKCKECPDKKKGTISGNIENADLTKCEKKRKECLEPKYEQKNKLYEKNKKELQRNLCFKQDFSKALNKNVYELMNNLSLDSLQAHRLKKSLYN
jgi:hypothetical protein